MTENAETARTLGRLLAQQEAIQRSLQRIESDALRILSSHDALSVRVSALEAHRAASTASRRTIVTVMGIGVAIGGFVATLVKLILETYGVI